MSYLPELRDSLVEAARQRYSGEPEPTAQRRAPRWLTAGGVATALASGVAVAVALVVLVFVGHRTSAPRAAGPAVTRASLRQSAADALSQVVLPRDAVPSRLVRGTPIELWSASDQLRIANHVDVFRIWRLRERPDRVILFIAAHRPPGSLGGMTSEAGGAVSGGPTVIQQAGGTITLLATGTGIWRELALNAVALPGGGTALRVDGEAGWLRPLPVADRIPSDVTRVRLDWAKRGTPRHLSLRITDPRRVAALVSLFNSLPAARAGTGTCTSAPNGFLRFKFEGAGGTPPLAVAIWAPVCQNLGLTLSGRPSVLVMAGSPTMPSGAQILEFIAPLLPARWVASSGTTVNSSHGCMISVQSTQAQSQSARGAAGGSCASASRSTTSASSP